MSLLVTDHLGRHVNLSAVPKRIISICPAITETLFALGLEKEIVGRTKYCIFPKEDVENVPIVGGTKEVNEETIRDLQPDLILAEKEENTKEIVHALEKIAPVFVLEVQKIDEAYRLIETLGLLTNREKQAKSLITTCKTSFPDRSCKQNLNAAYVIWRKPYMVVGGTTYINDVLHTLGFRNPFGKEESRYPMVTKEELADANLDVLLLASEPFPFQEKHLAEFQAFLPNTNIFLVDGEMFWYGAKMVIAGAYLKKLTKKIEKGTM
ncbi:ABC transporter substrate-binding protein [Neobacillus vireti]|uniref:ABC transporter substrate-binding protein n=1 Tax=Neobacillus vireti LMG 21834 TaxID=1131730 RepID=A0AB94IS15_9BACI|nr:helical backbone metal receptor [Neobacillus vireti]ETI69757.1 ABC transporter substrate-binding protein [Neobacillus vireti LMG 21834]KLT17880.1 iron ABC transporter substrate-binding protein [Neobacillus vireti]